MNRIYNKLIKIVMKVYRLERKEAIVKLHSPEIGKLLKECNLYL